MMDTACDCLEQYRDKGMPDTVEKNMLDRAFTECNSVLGLSRLHSVPFTVNLGQAKQVLFTHCRSPITVGGAGTVWGTVQAERWAS